MVFEAFCAGKAADGKDTSQRVPTGIRGTVIDVQFFIRDGIEKDQRALSIKKEQLDQFRKDLKDEYRIVEGATYERLTSALKGQEVISGPGLKKGAKLEEAYLAELQRADWFKLRMKDDALNELLEKSEQGLEDRKKEHEARFDDKNGKLQQGDALDPGVLTVVEV